MNIQTVIVAIILLAALAYIGQIVRRKVQSFSKKSGCGTGCGCSSSPGQKKIIKNIG